MSGSPLIVDQKVIVTPGGRRARASWLQPADGEPIWHSLNDRAGYTSPILATRRPRAIVWISGSVLWDYGGGRKQLWEFPFRLRWT